MTGYYETLNVAPDADAQAIKRAYFQQVRKFPPDRYPEEFQKIRTAYDALRNPQSRKSYDGIRALSPVDQSVFQIAQEARNLEDRISLLLSLVKNYPENEALLLSVVQAYKKQGKTGKAAAYCEKLYAMAPENIDYIELLAHAYYDRSWNKKALALYDVLVARDADTEEVWRNKIEYYSAVTRAVGLAKVVDEAMLRAQKRGFESLSFYAMLFEKHAVPRKSTQNRFLEAAMDWMSRSDSVLAQDSEEALLQILRRVRTAHAVRLVPLCRDIARAANAKPEIFNQLEALDCAYYAEILRDEEYPSNIVRLMLALATRTHPAMEKAAKASEELGILIKAMKCLPYVRRLKRDHPEAYQVDADFFDEFLRLSDLMNYQPMMLARDTLVKRFNSRKDRRLSPEDLSVSWGYYFPLGDEPDEPDEVELANPFPEQTHEPERRKEAKVGRNDPCPCGSGKKYKRCCGA